MLTAAPPVSRGVARARRLGWGVVDQGMSSLTNFVCLAAVAHLLDPGQLGAYSLALVTYAVALNASRGLATDPMMVRLGGAERPVLREAIQRCTGTALLVGMITGAGVILVSLLLTGATRGALLALGLALPGLLLQDSWRYVFFVSRRGAQAFVNDLVWAAALAPALVLTHAAGRDNAFWFVLAWGASAAVAAVVGCLQTGVVPRPGMAWDWLSRHRDLGPRFMAEGVLASLGSQLRVYGIGIALGLTAIGYVQVVNTFLGPFLIVILGIGAVIVPELRRVHESSGPRLERACAMLGGALAAGALIWGTLLWIAVPLGLGQLLVGDVWRSAYPLLPLGTVAVMAGGITVAATLGLHALGAARRSLRAMILTTAVYVVAGVGGAFVMGLNGTMLGAAMAAWFGAAVWWWNLRTALKEETA